MKRNEALDLAAFHAAYPFESPFIGRRLRIAAGIARVEGAPGVRLVCKGHGFVVVSRNGRDNALVPGDVAAQTRTVLENGRDILEAAGMSLADVVSARVFLTGVDAFQAMNEAYRWVYDPPNRDEAIALISETTKAPQAIARSTYELYVDQLKIWPTAGEVDDAALRAVIELMGELGQLSAPLPEPSRYIDPSYLRKASAA